jgi:hypothetical protein
MAFAPASTSGDLYTVRVGFTHTVRNSADCITNYSARYASRRAVRESMSIARHDDGYDAFLEKVARALEDNSTYRHAGLFIRLPVA